MKVKNEDYAKMGGMVKELGCQIVTQILVLEAGFNNWLRKSGQNSAPLTARWYPPRDTQSRGPSLIPQTATFCIAMDAKKHSSFAAKIKRSKEHEKYF